MFAAAALARHQNPVDITHHLGLLFAVGLHGVTRHLVSQEGLHLTHGNFAVPILVGVALHALHQVIAEDAVLEVGAGAGYLAVGRGRDDAEVRGVGVLIDFDEHRAGAGQQGLPATGLAAVAAINEHGHRLGPGRLQGNNQFLLADCSSGQQVFVYAVGEEVELAVIGGQAVAAEEDVDLGSVFVDFDGQPVGECLDDFHIVGIRVQQHLDVLGLDAQATAGVVVEGAGVFVGELGLGYALVVLDADDDGNSVLGRLGAQLGDVQRGHELCRLFKGAGDGQGLGVGIAVYVAGDQGELGLLANTRYPLDGVLAVGPAADFFAVDFEGAGVRIGLDADGEVAIGVRLGEGSFNRNARCLFGLFALGFVGIELGTLLGQPLAVFFQLRGAALDFLALGIAELGVGDRGGFDKLVLGPGSLADDGAVGGVEHALPVVLAVTPGADVAFAAGKGVGSLAVGLSKLPLALVFLVSGVGPGACAVVPAGGGPSLTGGELALGVGRACD